MTFLCNEYPVFLHWLCITVMFSHNNIRKHSRWYIQTLPFGHLCFAFFLLLLLLPAFNIHNRRAASCTTLYTSWSLHLYCSMTHFAVYCFKNIFLYMWRREKIAEKSCANKFWGHFFLITTVFCHNKGDFKKMNGKFLNFLIFNGKMLFKFYIKKISRSSTRFIVDTRKKNYEN